MGRKTGAISKKLKYQILYFIPKLDIWVPLYKVASLKECGNKLDLKYSTVNNIYKNKDRKLNRFIKIKPINIQDAILHEN